MTIADDEDIIVAIPDDSITIDEGKGEGAPAAEKKPAVKDEPKTGWRASPLAKGETPDKAEADRIAEIERERDEARRVAEEERAARAEAEAAARAALEARGKAEDESALRTDQAVRAHWARLGAERNQIEAAITATQERERSARAAFIAAREAGDAAKEADALAALADSKAAIAQLEQGKIAIEDNIATARRTFEERQAQRDAAAREPKAEPKREPEPPKQVATPEQWIDTTVRNVMGEAGADWLRQNKQFATDPKQNRTFLAFADLYAIEHGQAALKSDEFLEALNDKFFPDRERGEEPERQPEPEKPVRRTQAAAPVSRNGNQYFSSRNLNAGQIKLPPALASRIKSMGLDPTKYALQAVEDIKAGRLPKNFLDPDYDHGI